MRPRKYYVVFEYGRASYIVEGHAAARRLHSDWNGHRTRLAAEEFAMWWNHTRLSDTKEQTSSHRPRPL